MNGDGPDPDDELLVAGSRWQLPRWLWVAAAVALSAVVVVTVAARHGAHRTAPLARPSLPTRTAPGPAGDRIAVDLTVAGTRTVVLHARTVETIAASGARRVITLSAAERSGIGSSSVLVSEPAHGRVWLVGEGVAASRLIEFDVSTLRRIRDLAWRWAPLGAAVLDGHLVLVTDEGVADLAPDGRAPRFVPGLSGAVGPVATDPSRGRFVILDLGFPTDVWTYRPGRPPAEAARPLRFVDGTVEVVAGAIWVGGFGAHAAVLERLDPRTLAPVAASRLSADLGPGADLVAAGSRVLWVRDGERDDRLWCVDAGSGVARQAWSELPGAVASSGGPGGARAAVVTPRGTVSRLSLAGCPG